MKKKFLFTYLGVFATLLTVFQTKTKLRIQNKTNKVVYCFVSNLKEPRRKVAEIPNSPDTLVIEKRNEKGIKMTSKQLKSLTYLWTGIIKLNQGFTWFEVDANGNVKCWKLNYLPLYYNVVPSKIIGDNMHHFPFIDHLIIHPNGLCKFVINKNHENKKEDRHIEMTAKPIGLNNIFW